MAVIRPVLHSLTLFDFQKSSSLLIGKMAATICYWDIRGLAQPIRLLLEYTATPYEDKKLACGPAPDFDKSCWLDIKVQPGAGLSQPALLHRRGCQAHPDQCYPQAKCEDPGSIQAFLYPDSRCAFINLDTGADPMDNIFFLSRTKKVDKLVYKALTVGRP